jgi:4-amino-4-deoxy-L-arabinose transferase-like glycosyltransferase
VAWLRRHAGGIAIVLGVSLLVKLGILLWIGDIGFYRDEAEYDQAGRSLAEGSGIEYVHWKDELHEPPLYPWFVGLVYSIGGGPFHVRLAQVILSTVTVGLLYLLGTRWFGPRASRIGAGLFAFDPTLMAFTHYYWNETLFLFLLTAGALLCFDRRGSPSRSGRLFAAGVVLGLAALVRVAAAYLLLCYALWVLLSGRFRTQSWIAASSLLLGLGIVVTPYCISIARKYDGFLFITSGGAVVWHNNYNTYAQHNSDWGFPMCRQSLWPQYHSDQRHRKRWDCRCDLARPAVEDPNPVSRNRAEMRAAMRFAAENPFLTVRRCGQRLVELLNPTSFLIRHLRLGRYNLNAMGATIHAPPPVWFTETVVAVTVASYLLVMLFAVLGLASMPGSSARSFSLTTILFFLLFSALTMGMSRYRLPIIPFAALAAGFFLARPRASIPTLFRPKRAVFVGLLLLMLVWIWSIHFGKIWMVDVRRAMMG